MTEQARQAGGDHYVRMSVQPWDVIDTWPVEQQIGYHRGNILKYLMRMESKEDRLVQCDKLLHCAQKLRSILNKT